MTAITFGSPEARAILEADRESRYEHERETETVECHKCRADVELVYETEEWEQDEESGEWMHSSFGPGVGYCEHCRIIFCDSFDGLYAYYEKNSHEAN